MSAEVSARGARPWRVHDLASDFTLLDLWNVPVHIEGNDCFDDFYRLFVGYGARFDSLPPYSLRPRSVADVVQTFRLFALGGLVAARVALGRVLRLDSASVPQAIPGCREVSLRERLTAEDRRADRSAQIHAVANPFAFEPVYVFDAESLHEVSNRTIHALLHLSWIEDEGAPVKIGVYVKSRGWPSDLYLALIKPFRYAIVYPAWIRHLVRTWQHFAPEREAARQLRNSPLPSPPTLDSRSPPTDRLYSYTQARRPAAPGIVRATRLRTKSPSATPSYSSSRASAAAPGVSAKRTPGTRAAPARRRAGYDPVS